MPQLLEAAMVICFGVSWPLSIFKSFTSRTAKGKSIVFLIFIWVGYVFGIISKIIPGNITYVFVFYVINIIMVSADIVLWFRNRRLDRASQQGGTK